MKTLVCVSALAGLLSLGVPFAPAAEGGSKPLFNFSLLPKPFQKNPQLEMTVFTEFTDFGRTLRRSSPEQPVYFQSHDKGASSMGAGMAGERLPVHDELVGVIHGALSEQGFLPADGTDAQPELVLIFHWGSHYRLDLDLAGMFPELHRQHVLERATLVGGRAYRDELMRQIDFGYLPGERSLKKAQLFHQAVADLYYVVVSAYDLASVANDRPRLAWRTTMTVTAAGVAMQDALPPLIMTAGDFFGREMTEPTALLRNVRRGTVEMGPLRYIGEVDEPDPSEPK